MKQIIQIGVGEFGPIYEGVKGKEAVSFLLEVGRGEVPNAMERSDIGSIDFVYGERGERGYGLAHIAERHSEIIPFLENIIMEGVVFQQAKDRLLLLKKVPFGKGVAVLRLDWNGKTKQWLVSMF